MTANPSAVTDTSHPSAGELWVRRSCALVVAAVAAYSSYAHQQQFALDGGADPVSAALWPLSVDGLVILASTGLLKERLEMAPRARWTVRLAFLLGVLVSLAANIAAAPMLSWQPVLVAGWPPLALLLAVELVLHARRRDGAGQTTARETRVQSRTESIGETTETHALETHANGDARRYPRHDAERPTATEVMWAHYERELAAGRVPTGAELDRVAGTNNYGRAVLARWRRSGRLADPATAYPDIP